MASVPSQHTPEELERYYFTSSILTNYSQIKSNRFRVKVSEEDSDSVGTPVLFPPH